MTGYKWVFSDVSSQLPASAVEGGIDSDGSTIYVGRAYHSGDMVPAKIIPSRHEAYVCYGGEEISKNEYEVLCREEFVWIPARNGDVHARAIVAGQTAEGEPLYVGRVHHEGAHTVGKIHTTHGCLYIPYAGQERRFSEYEVLVLE